MTRSKPKFKLTKLSRLQVKMPGKTDLEPRLMILIKEGDWIYIERAGEKIDGHFCIVDGKLCIRKMDNTDRWIYIPIHVSDKVFLKERQ